MNYVEDKFQLGAMLRFNSKKDISDFNITEGIDNHDLTPIVNPNATEEVDIYFGSPRWMTIGFNSSYAFNENWKLQGMINNIFDQEFVSNGYFFTFDDDFSVPGTITTVEGAGFYPQAGINFLLGATIRF